MPCYHPLSAYKTAAGDVVWSERGDIVSSLFLPCGQCIGCKLERSRQWAIRVMHEASLYEDNGFLTLTYDDEHVPQYGGLVYRHFQLFMKRLRKVHDVRFFGCGEYGDELDRPHFHAAIFGYAFRGDRSPWKVTGGDCMVYRSAELERLWPMGFSSVGELTFESAAYIARYVCKKLTKSDKSSAEAVKAFRGRYERVDEETGEIVMVPSEFVHMSLKPGIGADWFKEFRNEVFPLDRVVSRGVPCKPPKFYDVLEGRARPDVLEAVKIAREERAKLRGDNSEERLAVKEIVARCALKHFKRSLK